MAFQLLTNEDIVFTQIYYFINDKTGKKTPLFENNKLTISEIKKRNEKAGFINIKKKDGNYFTKSLKVKPTTTWERGDGERPLSQSEYNSLELAYSIYLKYTDDLYVIDIDDVEVKSLKDFIKKLKKFGTKYDKFIDCIKDAVWMKGNTKGIHIYIKIFNTPEFSRQVDVFGDELKVDLLKQTNTWEKVGKKVYNYNGSLTGVEFDEIAYVFEKLDKKESKDKEDKVSRIERVINHFNRNFKLEHEPSKELIKQVIEQYPKEYFGEYLNWLNLTTVLKYHNQKELWDEISQQYPGYNKQGNLNIWNGITAPIDINFLIYKSKDFTDNDIPYIEKYKDIDRVDFNTLEGFDKLINTDEYLTNLFKSRDYAKYQVIGINSGCGTGKTYGINKLTSNYIKTNPKTKFLSIVNKISLAEQHVKTFNDIKLVSYQDKNKRVYKDNLVVCINSLLILNEIDSFKNYIVYIDEITDFLKSLTNSNTMTYTIREIFTLLLKIVRECKKLIVSDNEINQAGIDFINFKEADKKIMVVNRFKKFEGKEAIRLKNEIEFINSLRKKITNQTPFILASDSRTSVRQIYAALDNDNVKVYTGGDGQEIENINYEYILYSPRISTGVDFNTIECDSYLYIKGKSIDSELLYQQVARNRKITKLYYYCNGVESEEPSYSNIEDCRSFFTNLENINNRIFERMCVNENVEDDCYTREVVDNRFFKLFTLNEYNRDCYFTNIRIHFENILRNDGWVLDIKGDEVKISNEEKKLLKEAVSKIDDEIFNRYLEGEENPVIEERVNILQIDADKIEEYREILKDDKEFNNHLNTSRVFYSKEYIKSRLRRLKSDSFGVLDVRSAFNKLYYLYYINEKYGIELLKSEYLYNNEKIDIEDEDWEVLRGIFRSNKEKPSSVYQMNIFIVQAYKNITGVSLYKSKRRDITKNIKVTDYYLNEEAIKYHYDLARIRIKPENFSSFVERFN